MTFNWRDHIVRNPDICGGEPTMKGTRLLLRQVLADLASGTTFESLHGDYPSLIWDHFRAAAALAAQVAMTKVDTIEMPTI